MWRGVVPGGNETQTASFAGGSLKPPLAAVHTYTGSSLVSRWSRSLNRSARSVCHICHVCFGSALTPGLTVISYPSELIQAGPPTTWDGGSGREWPSIGLSCGAYANWMRNSRDELTPKPRGSRNRSLHSDGFRLIV